MHTRRVTSALGLVVLGVFAAQAQQRRPLCDPDNGGITLPAGFCAAVVADNVGTARHIALSPRGDLYVMQRSVRAGLPPGDVIALRDDDGDGRFERQERFGAGLAGTAIAWRDPYLYIGANTKIVRYRMGDTLVPTGEPEIVVDGFNPDRQHAAKPFAFGPNGELFVHVGPPSNACQNPDRTPGAAGQQPCPLLALHGGIWKYDANTLNQKHSASKRYSTGMRHTVSLVWNPAARGLYGVQHGRDQLHEMWPKLFTVEQNAELPAEELQRYTEGSNFGWPYCYYDLFQQKRVLAPEYGGDGKKEGDCAKYDKPLVTFPAHMAPNALLFYTGAQFPASYRGGAFIGFHGSWNRAPLPQKGYNVMFVPFTDGKPAGKPTVFADGFGGAEPVMDPRKAAYRPSGIALARDGSIYVSDDAKGRIWRIAYTSQR
ncbi:MAG: PQQ-dependent sugar dehydrogenase [Vicinamibacterales bacterium]